MSLDQRTIQSSFLQYITATISQMLRANLMLCRELTVVSYKADCKTGVLPARGKEHLPVISVPSCSHSRGERTEGGGAGSQSIPGWAHAAADTHPHPAADNSSLLH